MEIISYIAIYRYIDKSLVVKTKMMTENPCSPNHISHPAILSYNQDMKVNYRILLIIHLFVGLGALGGGLVAIVDPYKPLGIPVELLEGSPFSNYLVPGLILFVIIGMGHIFSALTVIKKSKWQGYISSVFSWALMIWIVVQCIIINTVEFLHILYFLIGLLGAVLAMRILFEQGQFPANVITDLTGVKRKK